MGVLDKATVLALEGTYADTSPTFTDGIEALGDGSELVRTEIARTGMRQGQQARRPSRFVNAGGQGSLEFYVPNKGFGFVQQALVGTTTGPTQVAATTAYETTSVSTQDGPDVSFAAQVQKPDADGTVTSFTHLGAVFTDWTLAHPLDDSLKFTGNWFSSDVVTNIATATATYPTNDAQFDWGMAGYTINGGAFRCVNSFKLSTALGFKTDRRCQRQNSNPKQPVRSGLPAFTGQIDMEYIGNDVYDLFRADTEFPIVAHWLGAEIETGHNYELTVTMPHCKIVGGATPQNTFNGDMPMQSVPFEAFHGTSDTISMVFKSTDTTL